MKHHRLVRSGFALALMLAANGGPAVAQITQIPRPMHQTLTPKVGATPFVPQGPQHRVFGLLQSATGTALVVRLRNGRDLQVDASQAFALKRVSEPLFHGKPTTLSGTYGSDGVLHATVVQRAAPNPTNWDIDR